MKINRFLLSAAMFCFSLLFSCVPEIEQPEPPQLTKYSDTSIQSSSSSFEVPLSSNSIQVVQSSSSKPIVSVSSSSVAQSSSAIFTAASSSSNGVSNVSYCNYGGCSQWSSDGLACLMHEYGYPNEGGCYQMPTNDNCMSGTIVAVCPAGTEPPAVTAKPSSSSIVPPKSSTSIVGTESGTFTDDRDDKSYRWVKIGEQVWMAQNLNYNVTGSKCYSNNEANCDKYGRLYDWAIAMDIASTYNSTSYSAEAKHKGVCPDGWHIPSGAEWDALILYVNPNCSLTLSDCANAGRLLKATSGWNNNGNGTDAYGFAALPTGHSNGGAFAYAGTDADWWSTDNKASTAYRWHVCSNNEYADWQYANKPFFWGVRCIKD